MKERKQKKALQIVKQKSNALKPKRRHVPPHSPKKEGEKKCVLTGKFFPKSEMLRFVLTDEGALVPDILGKLPGRGIWVRADRNVLSAAFQTVKPFYRAARKKVDIRPDLITVVDTLLVKRCQNLIGLARKSGFVFVGFTKVKAAITKYKKGFLLVAQDASESQIEKLGLENKDIDVKMVRLFSRQELDDASGFQNVVFVFIRKTAETAKLFEELLRIELYYCNNAYDHALISG